MKRYRRAADPVRRSGLEWYWPDGEGPPALRPSKANIALAKQYTSFTGTRSLAELILHDADKLPIRSGPHGKSND